MHSSLDALTATPAVTEHSFLQAALDLASQGFRVFPLIAGTKLPKIKDFPNQATTGADKIRSWWKDEIMEWEGDHNVGISTEGLLVLDVDAKGGKGGPGTLAALEHKHGTLPSTVTALTPTGGWHLYFRLPKGHPGVVGKPGGLGNGLDIRSFHNLVVAPGSIRTEGIYTWKPGQSPADIQIADAPEWLLGLCRRIGDRSTSAPMDSGNAISAAVAWLSKDAPLAPQGDPGNKVARDVASRVAELNVSQARALPLIAEHWGLRCTPQWEILDLADDVLAAYDLHAKRPRAAAHLPLVDLDTPEATERATAWLTEHAPPAVEDGTGDITTYKVAARLRDLGVSEGHALSLMLEYWNDRCEPPWAADDLERKVANAYQYGQNAPGSATAAADFGGEDMAAGIAAFQAEMASTEGTVSALERMGQDAAASRRPRSYLMKDARISDTNPYLIEGLLDAGMVSVIYGDSGQGKSFVTLNLGYHIASGKSWNGREVKQGLVVYVALEGAAGLPKRLIALRQQYGFDVPLVVLDFPIDLRPGAKDVGIVIQECRAAEFQTGCKCELVIIDTFSRATAGADENSASDMNAVMKEVMKIQKALRSHVMLVHHTGKDKSKGARGSGAVRNAAETEIFVDNGKMIVGKERDEAGDTIYPFERLTVDVGRTERDKPVTSCVIRWKSLAEVEFEQHVSPGQAKLAEVLSPAARQLRDIGAALITAKAAAQSCPRDTISISTGEWYSAACMQWRKCDFTPKGRSADRSCGATLSKGRFRTVRGTLIDAGHAEKKSSNQWFVYGA